MNGRRYWLWALVAAAMVGFLPHDGLAERLPVRRYSTADGLASDYIVSIYRDSRGFLWFSTRDGLSRFDGVRFTNYGGRDGLPTATINRVLETRAGVYWIATNGGGVCRFNPRGRRPADAASSGARQGEREETLFTQHRVGDDPATNRVNVLHEDLAGQLWMGTDAGLFRLDDRGGRVEFRRVDLPLVPANRTFHGVVAIAQDAEGSLWIGGGFGLRRRLPDGRHVVYRLDPVGAREGVFTLLPTEKNRVLIGLRSGLLILDPDPASRFAGASEPSIRTVSRSRSASSSQGEVEIGRWFNTSDGLPSDHVNALALSTNGHVWVGTPAGLADFDGSRFRLYTTANGLTDDYIIALEGDTAGNLWVGTVAGVTRLIRHGLVTFDQKDGLSSPRIHSMFQDIGGHLITVSGDFVLSEFDGTRFVSVRPNLPAAAACSWMSSCGYLDRAGDWWMLSTAGLHRFPRVSRIAELARLSPRATYTTSDGLPTDVAYRMFEDGQGAIWVGTSPEGIASWRRSAVGWRVFSEPDGLPAPSGTMNMASAFADDPAGNLWIGFYNGGLARSRNGRFQTFGTADGAPAGLITALYRDSAGRLWIGSNQSGLTRVADPSAPHPTFKSVTPAGNVRCVIEDTRGRIYAGTSRGIDRLDPATGRVEHFGTGEGLASEFVTTAFRDADGMLWFGTISGLSRLDPSLDDSASPPRAPSPALISAVRGRGVSQRVSDLGETQTPTLTLSPDQNQLEIEFFSIAFHAGESPRYQYRIEDVDRDWSAPTELRSVNYGRLPSGSHRFLVRSVRSDGPASEAAVVAFTVLPPIYARWWFISLALLFTAALAFAFYRIRVAQLLRVERVRGRIATDLHDDIGASLSQIAILAEVAQAQTPGDKDPTGPLARIAETSRGLVDSMSDIVWAINPQVDSLSDLIHRMRRFAEDTLGASEIDLMFREPEHRGPRRAFSSAVGGEDRSLGPEIRREIFLILKESVTNIAKHAECTRVTIELECDRRHLRMRVTDDGRGFDPAQQTDGNGVANMRRRIAGLRGRLNIQSKPGRGTSIELEVPL